MSDETIISTQSREGPAPSQNFIHEFHRRRTSPPAASFAGHDRSTPVSRPSPTATSTSATARRSIIDFGTAEKFGGLCNLRMDDTNPAKEDTEYVDAIQEDIHWLGFDWGDRFFYGSDYFEKTVRAAPWSLIKKGLAYVCELTPEQFREYRGDVTTPARSPWRDRPIEESLDLFERMKNGEFPEGKYTLRAKIDLASGNFNMRDPVLYRINYIAPPPPGRPSGASIPMYDFAHPIQDALEGITHSLCSLEYEDHRPLYDWVIDTLRRAQPSPGRSSLPAWASTTRSCPSASCASWWRRARSPAGTTPGCPPCAACAAGAIPPSPSATSASASAWPRPPPPWSTPFWSTACGRT